MAEKRSYYPVRLSDVIRKELANPNPSGKELQDKGDELRSQKGESALVEMAIPELLKRQPERIVIDGIRNPGEVKYLRRFSNFFLIGMDGNRDERLKRYRVKMKAQDPAAPEISDQDFFKLDERDSGKGQPPHGQNVTRCLDLADFQIINNTPWDNDREIQDKLYGKAEILLNLIAGPGSKRPSMQEIGMHLAYSASLKSPCLKRQVGATIAREINKGKGRTSHRGWF